jgi:signal transduction histidine kinase
LPDEEAVQDLDRATALYRILQESLTNVARHAHARKVAVSLELKGGHVILTVKDHGRGITIDEQHARKSLGLLGMRERALMFEGDVTVVGETGKGTTVTARIPVVETEKNDSQ